MRFVAEIYGSERNKDIDEIVRVLRYGVQTATIRKQLRPELRRAILDWCGENEVELIGKAPPNEYPPSSMIDEPEER